MVWCCGVVRRREDVAQAYTKSAATATAAAAGAKPSSSGSRSHVIAAPLPATSAWTALPRSTSDTADMSLFETASVPVGSFYCDYCNIFCNSETQLDAHCASTKHKLNISSDREHQWNFRPPPLTVADGQYTLCPRSELFCSHCFTTFSLIAVLYLLLVSSVNRR